jgi:hypothetical protein
MQSKVEVWKNTATGTRWYISFDLQGRETTKTVQGGRTFTLSTFERQINQERAVSSKMDLFRNGTFVLAKGSEDTEVAEIESPNSLTDAEIAELVQEVVYGDLKVEDAIANIESPVTLGRVWEALVLDEKSPKKAINAVKKKQDSFEATVAVEREVVSTKPEE